jgi:hypothetical protein
METDTGLTSGGSELRIIDLSELAVDRVILVKVLASDLELRPYHAGLHQPSYLAQS